tara:strand:- start:688 stop:1494 length:807 start_codon:yes stop_codon:yes gene_type:complete
MAIDKITGVSWDSIANVSGVAKANIANFNGQDAPSAAGLVTTDLVFHIDPADSSSYPGSGSTIYDLVGSTNGTLQGNASVDGNGHLILDGVNDAVNFGTVTSSTPVSVIGTSFSINCWVYNNGSGESFQTPFSQWSSSGNDRIEVLRVRSNGYIQSIVRDSGTSYSIVTNGTAGVATPLAANTWYYYTWNYDSSTTTATIYFNASQIATKTTRTVSNVNKNFRTGSRGTNVGIQEWNGKLGAYHVYDRVLSSTEITQNYNATKATYGL